MRLLCCVKPSTSKKRCRVSQESTEKVSPPQSVQNVHGVLEAARLHLVAFTCYWPGQAGSSAANTRGYFFFFFFSFPMGDFLFLDLDSLVHVSYGCFFSFFNHQAHINKYSQKTLLSLHCRCWFILYWIRLLPLRRRLFPWKNIINNFPKTQQCTIRSNRTTSCRHKSLQLFRIKCNKNNEAHK